MGQSDEKLSFGNPIIIVSIYLVTGIIWIFFSDVILAINIRDMPSLIFFQSFKGILYILSTSIVIYYLINRGFNKVIASEQILTESERKHKIILDTVGDIILYTDKYGKILDINKRIETKLGFKKDELLGKSFMDVGILDIKYVPVIAKMYRQGLSNNHETKIELGLKHKSGEVIIVEADNKFITQNGEVIGAVTAFRDITERKKALVQIENNIEHFAHLIDHIRNPLAILNTYVQVRISDPEIKQDLQAHIDKIDETIKQLDEGWMDTEDTRKFLKSYK
ncbi:MAG: sensory histidine kinase AtoS [Euryarchaeota archaeon ADurb.Bin023]|uniref:Sensory histidine kinase AtoS n=1 Tax=Candidatus Methanofastidiosum methylothiophilum TaxID=1705564 RepID=A0A150JMG3_9EURY|nr:MAG: sensory histidine kinase AtoS [Candidatus Methanofastidiosum methylthiophilus]OQC52799.1 MAG: sensory histidine kinase AtoS [Euryarchaeota archaeon ADurb.Bin023]HNV94109.1 PAS domain S-box protein [Methanofastidiosum sp.]KYC58450.1 MAG: sensory histidine kinase AtoS [Candidatus Methanofastidiosum methylthiophilus]HOE92907.1 PAS domain S-box protein [Methanofastidiosum sp.]